MGVFLYFCPYSNHCPTKKDVFLYYCSNPNQRPAKKVVFSVFALTLTKALQQRGLFLYFCTYSNQSPTKQGVFLYFCQSSTTNSGFLYFCPYSNQFNSNLFGNHISYNKPKLYQKWRFFHFAFILTKTQPKRVYFSLFLPLKPCSKGGCFSIFALILTKALPKNGVYLYFCPYSYQSPTKKGVFSILPLFYPKT